MMEHGLRITTPPEHVTECKCCGEEMYWTDILGQGCSIDDEYDTRNSLDFKHTDLHTFGVDGDTDGPRGSGFCEEWAYYERDDWDTVHE